MPGPGRVFLVAAATALGVVLAYLPALHAPFYLDDFHAIVESPIVRDASSRGASAALSGLASTFSVEGRPLAAATFVLNRLATGPGPAGFRAVNLLLHLGSFAALFLLFRSLLEGRGNSSPPGRAGDGVPLLAAALWAAHPVQVQSVTYVVQRMTSGMTFFFLLSLLCFLRAVEADSPGRRAAGWAGAIAAGAASLGFKQNAVLLPFFWGMLRAVRSTTDAPLSRREKIAWVAGLSVLAAAIALRGWATARAVPPVDGIGFFHRALTQGRVFADYLVSFLLPLPGRFHLLHDYRPSLGFFSPPATAAGILLAAVFALAIPWAWKRDRIVGLGLAWAFAGLLPESLLPYLDLAFDHRLYLPSAGLCLAIARLAGLAASRGNPTPARARLLAAGSAIAVALLLLSTGWRNRAWADPVRFFEAEVAAAPGNPKAHIGRVDSLLRAGKFGDAVRAGEEALKRDWRDPLDARFLRTNLAVAHLGLGDWEGARRILEPAVSTGSPNLFEIYNLGVARYHLSDRAGAREMFERVLAADPGHPDANYYSGLLLMREREPGVAARRFETVLAARPRDAAALAGAAVALAETGDLDGAARAANRIVELARTDPAAAEEIPRAGFAYIRAGRYAAAEKILRLHLESVPMDREARYNLACALSRQGRTKEALEQLDQALAGGIRYEVLYRDEDLAAVRQTREFGILLRKHKISPHENR